MERVGGGVGSSSSSKKKKTTKKSSPYKPPPVATGSGTKTSSGKTSFSGTFTDPSPPLPTNVSFEDILKNDPFYQAALANLNAAGVYDKASRDQAIKQAMIRFGFAPEAVAGMTFPEPVLGQPGHVQPRSLADILDPATRSLAEQNTTAGLSIWARLKDAQDQAQKRSVDVLGSRGLFRSGETGYQLKRGALAADQARYDATNKLMDFLTGAQAAYVQAEMQRQALLLQAQKDAADSAGDTPPPGGGTTPPPTGSGPHGETPPGHYTDPHTGETVHTPYKPPEGTFNPGPSSPGVTTPGWKPPVYKDPYDPYGPQNPFGWGQGGNSGGRVYPQ